MSETDPPRLGDTQTGIGAFRRSSLVVSALLVVIYIAARVWRLNASCLWFDEIFGVHAARHTWGGLWSFVAADLIHPPLFYALLKIWIAAGGESLEWLRLFPLLAAIACLVPVLLLARELRLGVFASNLALLLLAANGYLIKYAQEVRMYSLLLFFTLGSLWLFVRFLNEAGAARKFPHALMVCNLLLVYTHYYGWLVVGTQAAFLLVKERGKFKAFLAGAAALVVCFAPWVYACANAAAAGEGGGLAQNIGWIERPGPSGLAQFYALLHGPFYFRQSSHEPLYARWGVYAGFLLLALPVALLAVREWRGTVRGSVAAHDGAPATLGSAATHEGPSAHDRAALHFLLFFSFLPPALAFLTSHLLPHSVWGTRHLIVAAAPYMMLAAVALGRVRAPWLKRMLLALLCCWFFFAGVLMLVRREGTHIWCAWETLAPPLTRAETGGTQPADVYAFEDLVAYHLWFALNVEPGRFNISVVKNVPGLREDPAYFLPRGFREVAVKDASALEGERFWVAFRDTTWDEGREPLKLLKERGYRVEQVFETTAQGQRAFLVLVSRASQ